MKTFKEFIVEAEPWVLVQGRKEIKRFKRKPGNSAFTSSKDQELMALSKAKKMGIKLKEDKEVEKEFPELFK